MTRITVELPDELNASLEKESARRHVSKTELVFEGIGLVLRGPTDRASTAATAWLEEWSGTLSEADLARAGEDPRLAGILAKHLK